MKYKRDYGSVQRDNPIKKKTCDENSNRCEDIKVKVILPYVQNDFMLIKYKSYILHHINVNKSI